jgi:hypothetical protein
MSIILAHGRLKQENQEFETSLVYIAISGPAWATKQYHCLKSKLTKEFSQGAVRRKKYPPRTPEHHWLPPDFETEGQGYRTFSLAVCSKQELRGGEITDGDCFVGRTCSASFLSSARSTPAL